MKKLILIALLAAGAVSARAGVAFSGSLTGPLGENLSVGVGVSPIGVGVGLGFRPPSFNTAPAYSYRSYPSSYGPSTIGLRIGIYGPSVSYHNPSYSYRSYSAHSVYGYPYGSGYAGYSYPRYSYSSYDRGYYRPNYAVGGAMLGALAGGIIGHNSHHRGWEGAAIGAGTGLFLGSLAESNARYQESSYPAGAPVSYNNGQPNYIADAPTVNTAPSVPDAPKVPANGSSMSGANALFGR